MAIAQAQHSYGLKLLELSEHIAAQGVVLMTLDARADAMLKQALENEHSKNQKNREELGQWFATIQLMLSQMSHPSPS